MPKVKNSKHKVQVTLPDGFELVDGELVKKAHGGPVTGDQHDYGLTTFNPHTGQSMGPKDTDVRYSLLSVPRDIANIEAEGGETVLTDLNNDGQFGLYDITGPRHSSGGVPMLLPEQSFIFSDTQAMKMGKSDLAEHGIQSRKKITPAKVSKQYNLNKYYGILNDEYADKIQANTADLMLQKNKEGLSKLAFQSEMMKDFEEGVPLASYPYLQSIGIDPFEFAQKMEGMPQGPGDQQAQPMNEADAQAMSGMAAYGRELNQAAYGNAGGLGTAKFQRFNQYFDDQNYRPSIRSAYMPMDLGMTGDPLGAVSGLIEAGGRLFGKKDKDGDDLMDGAFRDMKAKRARDKSRKAMSYNYDINTKGNNPADYNPSAMELYDASTRGKKLLKKNTLEKGSAPSLDSYLQDNAMLKYNPESMEYDYKIKTPDQFRSKNKELRAEYDKGFEGYKSFGDMQSQMSNLPDYQKQTLRELGERLEGFKKDKASGDLPEGAQYSDLKDVPGLINNALMSGDFPMATSNWQDFNYLSPFRELGGGLKKAQFSTETDGPGSCGDGEVWDFMQQRCVPANNLTTDPPNNLTTDPGQLTANLIDNQSNPNTTFNQIANMGNQTFPDATVTRDRGNLGTRMQRGVDNFMNSPLVNAFAETSKFATAGADFLNEAFKKQRGRQAKEDLLKMSMADNMGVQEGTLLGQGTYDENTGNVFSIMQGVSPFGGNASYYGKDGFEIPRAQEGQETQSWKAGDELLGGTDSWNDWYMSDENKDGRKKRYQTYVFLKESQAKKQGRTLDKSKLPTEEEFHDTYVRAQKQINAIQNFDFGDPDYLKRTDWDSSWEFDPKYKNAKEALKAKEATKRDANFRYKDAIKQINDKIKQDAKVNNPDITDEELNKLLFKELDEAGIRVFQTGYQAGQIMNVADNDEFLKFIQSGIEDDTFTFNGVTYTISPEDAAFGNTTVGQREQSTVPTYPCKPCPSGPDKGKVPERDENGNCPCGECETCPEGKVPGIPTESEPCPCKDAPKTDEPEDAVMREPAPMTPFVQDLLKTQAIADRQ